MSCVSLKSLHFYSKIYTLRFWHSVSLYHHPKVIKN
jgi:hypothetical protein